MVKKILVGMLTIGTASFFSVLANNQIAENDEIPLEIKAEENPLETLNQSEYSKIAEALDVSLKNESIDMGEEYKLFDAGNEAFKNSFLVSSFTSQDSGSVMGHSSSEVSTSFGQKFGLSLGAAVGSPTPIGNVGLDVSSSFDVSASSALSMVNDEYFEYWQTYKAVKIAQIDWASIDVSTFLTTQAKEGLLSVSDSISAMKYLKKYGTHVFDNYYFGGTLAISRYICSSSSIAEESSESSVEFGLKADVGKALSMNASGENYSITNREINTSSTKTSSRLIVKGGNKLNGISPETIFTFIQEYASQYESGYVFAAWLDSISKCDSLRVVKVAKPVAIWDIFRNASLLSDDQYSAFEEAFKIMCYENYSSNCGRLNIAPGYIKSIAYSTDEYNVAFDLLSTSINLPEKSKATIEYGDLVTKQTGETFALSVKQGASYCSLEDNVLSISEGTDGKTIKLALSISDVEVFTFDIVVKQGDFKKGYGTAGQPYLLSTSGEWNQFISNTKYYEKKLNNNFKLLNDIDLGGRSFTSGGATKKNKFFGTIDGNFHTIKNFSVIYTGEWNNIGLIGINCGTIKNLFVENAKVMNSGVLSAENGQINAGVLVGRNYGHIEKVAVRNSSIRIAGSLDQDSTLNIGGLVGLNDTQSSISECSVRKTFIYGISYNNSGCANVGGLVGRAILSTIDNVYVARTMINVVNFFTPDCNYYIDGSNKDVYQLINNVWTLVGKLGIEYFYNKDTLELSKNKDTSESKSESEIVATKPILGDGEPAVSTLGGLIGEACHGTNASFCVAYCNRFNQTTGQFGFVAGLATSDKDEEPVAFENIYFESVIDKAVNGKSFDGCEQIGMVTLAFIDNTEWDVLWTDRDNKDEHDEYYNPDKDAEYNADKTPNDNGRPVLRWEVEQ